MLEYNKNYVTLVFNYILKKFKENDISFRNQEKG